MATTQQLTETLLDQNSDPMSPVGQPAAVWASTNTDVATVNATGLVTRGTIAGTANITVTRGAVVSNISTITVPSLGGGETLTMPTTAAASRELWFDADNDVVDGPAVALIGSPTHDPAAPMRYDITPLDSTAFNWGANLDGVFGGAFSVVVAFQRDTTGSERYLVHKTDITGQNTLIVRVSAGGQLHVRVFYALDGSTEESNLGDASLNNTNRHVVGFSFDPTQAFGSRIRLFVAGANQDAVDAPATVGAGAALPSVGSAGFRYGATSFGNSGARYLRALGVWSSALSGVDHAAIASYIAGEGWA